jgi:hypothetical protein
MSKRLLFLFAALLCMSGIAHGASISATVSGNRPIIQIGGEFTTGDYKRFVAVALPLEDALVIFDDSPGGSLDAALRIGVGSGQALQGINLAQDG